MTGPKFDMNDGDFIFGDDNFGIDSKGHTMLGIGDNAMIDTSTGDIHFVSGVINNIFDDDED